MKVVSNANAHNQLIIDPLILVPMTMMKCRIFGTSATGVSSLIVVSILG
jgi:hypothetical protein